MRMDFLGIGLIIEPIRLTGGIPVALGKSVTSLLFTETSQDLWGLGSDPALRAATISASFELVGAHSEQNLWRPIICVPHSLHSLGDSEAFTLDGSGSFPLAILR